MEVTETFREGQASSPAPRLTGAAVILALALIAALALIVRSGHAQRTAPALEPLVPSAPNAQPASARDR